MTTALAEVDPGPVFRSSFGAAVVNEAVRALERAVETARTAHLPERGGNETTFGICLYHYAVHELQDAVRRHPGLGWRARHVQQAFRLRVGEYTVACHKVGNLAIENIWGCFPNPGASHELVLSPGRPGWLPGMEPDIASSRVAVLAYMANPETGLEAVHLCIPTKETRGRISEWGYTQLVWERSAERVQTKPIGSTEPQELPPREEIQRPTVALRPQEGTS